MTSPYNFDPEWSAWEQELKTFLPNSTDRRRVIEKIVEIWMDLAALSHKLQEEPAADDLGLRYFGLDPLKITALKISQSIETNEVGAFSLSLQMTHNLILTNIMQSRLVGGGPRKFQTQFKASDLALFPLAQNTLENREKELWAQRERLQADIAALRDDYELFLFAESSHEAARSFGAEKPDQRSHRTSWDAFSQLLCSVALHIHEENKALLEKRSRRIEAQRTALFESCTQLLAKRENHKDAKKLHRQLRRNLAQIKQLEDEIESTLSELSIPSLNDYASFVVKKNPEQATTCEPTKIRPSTGDKT